MTSKGSKFFFGKKIKKIQLLEDLCGIVVCIMQKNPSGILLEIDFPWASNISLKTGNDGNFKMTAIWPDMARLTFFYRRYLQIFFMGGVSYLGISKINFHGSGGCQWGLDGLWAHFKGKKACFWHIINKNQYFLDLFELQNTIEDHVNA